MKLYSPGSDMVPGLVTCWVKMFRYRSGLNDKNRVNQQCMKIRQKGHYNFWFQKQLQRTENKLRKSTSQSNITSAQKGSKQTKNKKQSFSSKTLSGKVENSENSIPCIRTEDKVSTTKNKITVTTGL